MINEIILTMQGLVSNEIRLRKLLFKLKLRAGVVDQLLASIKHNISIIAITWALNPTLTFFSVLNLLSLFKTSDINLLSFDIHKYRKIKLDK